MEDKMFMQEYEMFMQTESDSESNAMCLDSGEEEQLVNHMTLGGMLKVLTLDNLLSELDDDLELIATGKKSVDEHKEYFKTQIDNKIKKLSKDYHPDRIRNAGGSKEEILQATEMQKKLNSVRAILRHFNEKFSECVDFKYSFFAQIEINFLSDENRLEQLSYGVLTKLGNLARIKHEKLVPNLNGFLHSSQISMKGFSENNLGDFLQGKSNALGYFSKYLSAHKKLVNELKLLKESFKKDDQLNPIGSMINKMLRKSMTQFKILNQLNELFNGSDLDLISIRFKFFKEINYPCCINKEDCEQADKYFTLPFIEYINILFLCNEICLKEQTEEQKNGTLQTLVSYIHFQTIANFAKKCRAIYKTTPIDDKIAKKAEKLLTDDLLLLNKISLYLTDYYCHNNEKGRELAAQFLGIDEISREIAGALLVKVIGMYTDCLAKRFEPEKSFYEQLEEVQREFHEDMSRIVDRYCEEQRRFNHKILNLMEERNAILIPRMKETIKANEDSIRESQDIRKAMQEVTAKLDAILNVQGKQAVIQNWQEEGAMFQSNCGKAAVAEEERCSSLESDDIKIIDQPNTDMSGLQLSLPSSSGMFK